MDWLAVVAAGGVTGWLAGLLTRTDTRQGILPNIIIGIMGAISGRWLFADVLGIGAAYTNGTLNLPGLLFGVLGAAILITLLKLLRLLG